MRNSFWSEQSCCRARSPRMPQGVPLPVADSPWLLVFPASFRAQLGWLAKRYPGVPIVVTENGVDVPGKGRASTQMWAIGPSPLQVCHRSDAVMPLKHVVDAFMLGGSARAPPLRDPAWDCCTAGEDAMSLETGLCDTYRVDFYRQYLGNASQVLHAWREGDLSHGS